MLLCELRISRFHVLPNPLFDGERKGPSINDIPSDVVYVWSQMQLHAYRSSSSIGSAFCKRLWPSHQSPPLQQSRGSTAWRKNGSNNSRSACYTQCEYLNTAIVLILWSCLNTEIMDRPDIALNLLINWCSLKYLQNMNTFFQHQQNISIALNLYEHWTEKLPII